jgi:hypothetical protein
MQLSAITIVGMLELDLSVWMRIVSADRSSSDMHGGSARRTTVSRYITGARMAAVNTKPARVDCMVVAFPEADGRQSLWTKMEGMN